MSATFTRQWCVVLLVSCASGRQEPPAAPAATAAVAPTTAEGGGDDDGSETESPMGEPSGPTTCTTRRCLAANDGQLVWLEGRYSFPGMKAFGQSRLLLADGARVVLSVPRKPPFVAANDGAILRLAGRIFTGEIPERYGIIGRSPDPHLVEVDLARVELVGR